MSNNNSYNEFPDIYTDGNRQNPFIKSPNAPYGIYFYATKETLGSDSNMFSSFINSCKANFRHSSTYTNYKSYLYEIGLDRCQMMPNIKAEDGSAKIEMHHNGIDLKDIIIIITNNFLNTCGCCTTFDVITELKRVHKANQVPLVMLSKTAHQLADNDDTFVVPAQMCFGLWQLFLKEHSRGITAGIAKKIYFFIKKSIELEDDRSSSLNQQLLGLREEMKGWVQYNEYGGICELNESSYPYLGISDGDSDF